MEIKISTFEYKFDVIQTIGNLIKEQTCLKEFSITGVQNCVEDLMPSLHSKSETLNLAKFENVHFTDYSLSLLSDFENLKGLKIWYCDGLSSNTCKILLNGEFPNLTRLELGCPEDDQDLTLSFLNKIGNSLKQLGLNLITFESVKIILNNCINLIDLQIIDYYPWENPWFFKLFNGLNGLKSLSISIHQDHQHYEKMILWSRIGAHDLPHSLRYLKLECGLPIYQLKRFLDLYNDDVTPNLSILIINDLNFDSSHMKIIREFVEKRKTLKVLGIGGPEKLSLKVLKELKILREKHGVHIIPKEELDQW